MVACRLRRCCKHMAPAMYTQVTRQSSPLLPPVRGRPTSVRGAHKNLKAFAREYERNEHAPKQKKQRKGKKKKKKKRHWDGGMYVWVDDYNPPPPPAKLACVTTTKHTRHPADASTPYPTDLALALALALCLGKPSCGCQGRGGGEAGQERARGHADVAAGGSAREGGRRAREGCRLRPFEDRAGKRR